MRRLLRAGSSTGWTLACPARGIEQGAMGTGRARLAVDAGVGWSISGPWPGAAACCIRDSLVRDEAGSGGTVGFASVHFPHARQAFRNTANPASRGIAMDA